MRGIFANGVLALCIAAAAAVAEGAKAAATAVTVNGCLQHDGGGFRLTRTSGANAPKVRSWKFGYLKKRSADLDVVADSSRKLKLDDHVGRQVALTGTMNEGELRAQSIHELAKSCAK